MTPAKAVTHYRLSPKAQVDLREIWHYSATTWSPDTADRYLDDLSRSFETIVEAPMLARERHEFDPPVRIHGHGRHLIVYRVSSDHIAILRILGGQQDWHALLTALGS